MKKKIKIALAAALLSFQTIFAFAELNYIEVGSISNAPIVIITKLSDFELLITKNNVSTAFLRSSDGAMFINAGGSYFAYNLKFYTSISDFKTGESLGFKSGKEYYEAKNLELPTAELYSYYKQNSFKSSADCIKAKENGFPASSEYYTAKELGYEKHSDYMDYLNWTGKGYKSKEDWQLAQKRGFTDIHAKTFYESQEQGFANYDDYNKARGLGFSKNDELQIFNTVTGDLEKIVKAKAIERKQAVIYYFIQKLQKDEFSLSVLSKSLKNICDGSDKATQKTITYFLNENDGNNNRHNSYGRNQINLDNLFSEKELQVFFEKVEPKELGTYSSKSEIFKKK